MKKNRLGRKSPRKKPLRKNRHPSKSNPRSAVRKAWTTSRCLFKNRIMTTKPKKPTLLLKKNPKKKRTETLNHLNMKKKPLRTTRRMSII